MKSTLYDWRKGTVKSMREEGTRLRRQAHELDARATELFSIAETLDEVELAKPPKMKSERPATERKKPHWTQLPKNRKRVLAQIKKAKRAAIKAVKAKARKK